MPPDVGEFVSEDRFDLRGCQMRERCNWEQNHRPEPANRGRCVNERRLHHVHLYAQAEPGSDSSGRRLPARRVGRERFDLEAAHVPQTARHADHERRDAYEPDDDDRRQQGINAGPHRVHRKSVVDRPAANRSRCHSRRRGCVRQVAHGRDDQIGHHQRPCAHDRCRQHGRESATGNGVSRVGRSVPTEPQRAGGSDRQYRALPEEMNQSPAHNVRPGIHRRPPLC